MSGQDYYAASYGQQQQGYPQHHQQQYQQPAYPSQHQYPNVYPPQTDPYGQGQQYAGQHQYQQPHQQQQSLAPYGSYGDHAHSRSPSPSPYGQQGYPQHAQHQPGQPHFPSTEDGTSAEYPDGADGERGLGTKIVGGGAAILAAKHFNGGGLGFFKTLAVGVGGAMAAEKLSGFAGSHMGGRREGEEGGVSGYGAQSQGQIQYPGYGPQGQQQQQQQYGQDQKHGHGHHHGHGHGHGGKTPTYPQNNGQYPGQPQYA